MKDNTFVFLTLLLIIGSCTTNNAIEAWHDVKRDEVRLQGNNQFYKELNKLTRPGVD